MRCARSIQRRSAASSGNKFEHQPVSPVDIFGIARQRDPAERPLADAEEWTDILRHKAGDIEGALDASQLRLGTEIVAVVEGHRAARLQLQHRLDMTAHGRHREPGIFLGVALAQPKRLLQRHSIRHIAMQRIMCAGLVGQHVWNHAALDQFRKHIGGIANESNR